VSEPRREAPGVDSAIHVAAAITSAVENFD